MSWQEIRSSVLRASATLLEPKGYEFVQSRTGFEKSSSSERRGVYLTLVASDRGNYSVQAWCGIRHHAIEEVFHRTSGVNKRSQISYTTLNLSQDSALWLNRSEERSFAISALESFIRDLALPFLTRDYSIADYSTLLNTNSEGRVWRCPYHGNPQNRCHYALIAAKLADDPRYEELKGHYAEFLRSTNNGFYYPRFLKFLDDLEINRA